MSVASKQCVYEENMLYRNVTFSTREVVFIACLSAPTYKGERGGEVCGCDREQERKCAVVGVVLVLNAMERSRTVQRIWPEVCCVVVVVSAGRQRKGCGGEMGCAQRSENAQRQEGPAVGELMEKKGRAELEGGVLVSGCVDGAVRARCEERSPSRYGAGR